jgi:hypothetical protein
MVIAFQLCSSVRHLEAPKNKEGLDLDGTYELLLVVIISYDELCDT